MTTTWLIYCHLNKINGKRYIGLTKHSNNLEKRWRKGLGYLNGHHKVFASAIEKYGWENFEHLILETDLKSLEEANAREQYWIRYYHSYIGDPNNWGYNSTIGGDGPLGRVMSTDEREYRRQLKLGTKASEETRRKMSQTRKGKKQNMTAKKVIALHKSQQAMIQARRKKIKCIETDTVYESITAASAATSIPKETISACLNGRLKTAWKLHWIFIEKGDT